MPFPPGTKTEADTKKVLKSLIAHELKEGKPGDEFIYLVITTEKPLTKAKDHVPRIIPIPNRLSRVAERSILLITKDPSTPYREPLIAAKSPTEDLIKDIFPLRKVKKLTRSSKSAKNLASEYDLILADHRIHHLLPPIMGEPFFKGHRKAPFVLQLAPFTEQEIARGKKVERIEKVDPKYVLQQMKSIAKNTYYFPSRDVSFQVKVGTLGMDVEKLSQNIGAVVEFLKNEKFAPAGGVLKKAGLKELLVKTGDSASISISQ